MTENKNPKQFHLQLDSNEIVNDYQKIAQNASNMVAFITSNLNGIEFNDIPKPPLFGGIELAELQYVGDKKIFLDNWIYNHALGDLIKGINLSLARANYLSELMKLNGKNTTYGDYLDYEKKLNKKHLRKDLPSSIEQVRKQLKKPLINEQYIKSINKVRACLEHRTGIVTEIDCNHIFEENQVLELKWICLQPSVVRNEKKIILDKPGCEINKGELLEFCIIEKSKIFSLGEHIQIDLQTYYELVFTGYSFVKFIADHIDFSR